MNQEKAEVVSDLIRLGTTVRVSQQIVYSLSINGLPITNNGKSYWKSKSAVMGALSREICNIIRRIRWANKQGSLNPDDCNAATKKIIKELLDDGIIVVNTIQLS